MHDYILKVRELDIQRDPTTLTGIVGARFIKNVDQKLHDDFDLAKEELIKKFEDSRHLFKALLDEGTNETTTITIEDTVEEETPTNFTENMVTPTPATPVIQASPVTRGTTGN
eukprot:8566490-Ditylum_brightwellii.AAC.1